MRLQSYGLAVLLLVACGSDDDDDRSGPAGVGGQGGAAGVNAAGAGAGGAGAGGAASGQGGGGAGGAGAAGQGGAGGSAGLSGGSGQAGGASGASGAAGAAGGGASGGAGAGASGTSGQGAGGALAGAAGAAGEAGQAGVGGACVADTQVAQLVKRPVDVMVYLDTSASMAPAQAAVATNIDQNFAQKIGASGLDYRVIMLTDADLPTSPKEPSRWFHYVNNGGSGAIHENLLSWYTTPAAKNLPPGGYSDWVRDGSFKVFLIISDTSSGPTMAGAEFDQKLLALTPARFGTAQSRDYRYHAIIGLKANAPASTPWPPTSPLVEGKCSGYSGGLGNGIHAQEVAVLTGGLRFPLCEFDHYDSVFSTIAEGIVKSTGVACDFPAPQKTKDGQPIDPNTILLDYRPGGSTDTKLISQVKDAASCQPDQFYITSGQIHLCPATCEAAKVDPAASIDVTYGCDVGYKP